METPNRAYVGFQCQRTPAAPAFSVRGPQLGASEDQGYNSKSHVLIDASQCQRLDDEPGLFPNLANNPSFSTHRTPERRRAVPFSIFSSLNNQGPPVLIDLDAGHARR